MSYAIKHLHLEHPPFSLERVVIDDDTMWASRCYGCDGRSRPYLLVSDAITAQHHHGVEHVKYECVELEELLNIPEVAPAPARRRRIDAGVRRRQELDRVHLHEPAVA